MFVTSDLHLGHRRVAEIRGFDDVDAHDEVVLRGIRRGVPDGQHLWILGDLTGGGAAKEDRALELLGGIRDEKGLTLHLVAGNHDSVSPLHRGAWRRQAAFFEVFTSVQHVARHRFHGHNIWFSHFPWFGGGDRDNRVSRGDSLRVHDDGVSFLVHGHLHGSVVRTGERSMDVGLDANGLKVWTWSQVCAELVGD